jgi:hypothetical protein
MGEAHFGISNTLGPIPKGCDITFSLANYHALPAGAVVSWMVRNSGKEAEDKNDLGHRVGEGFSVSRDSAYRGDLRAAHPISKNAPSRWSAHRATTAPLAVAGNATRI